MLLLLAKLQRRKKRSALTSFAHFGSLIYSSASFCHGGPPCWFWIFYGDIPKRDLILMGRQGHIHCSERIGTLTMSISLTHCLSNLETVLLRTTHTALLQRGSQNQLALAMKWPLGIGDFWWILLTITQFSIWLQECKDAGLSIDNLNTSVPFHELRHLYWCFCRPIPGFHACLFTVGWSTLNAIYSYAFLTWDHPHKLKRSGLLTLQTFNSGILNILGILHNPPGQTVIG